MALAVVTILLGPGPFAIYAGLVVLFALGEFYLAMQKRGYQPATALGLVSGALVLGAGYFRGENAMLAIMALSIFATFLWYMTVPAPHRRNLVSSIAITVLGVAYIPLLAAYALAVLKLPDGEGLTLSIIGLTFVYDTAAFAVGLLLGKSSARAHDQSEEIVGGGDRRDARRDRRRGGCRDVGSVVSDLAARFARDSERARGRGRDLRAARRSCRVPAEA